MRVTVRLFARLREIAGANEMVLDVEPPVTVAAVWRELARRHEALQPYAQSVSAACNLEYVRPDAEVSEGDEIAFLPPVSGGADGSPQHPSSGRRTCRRVQRSPSRRRRSSG